MLETSLSIKRTIAFFTILYGIIGVCLLAGSVCLRAIWGTDIDDLLLAVSMQILDYVLPLLFIVLIYWFALRFNLNNLLFVPFIVIFSVVPGVILFYSSELQGVELMDFLPPEILVFALIFIIQKIGRETLGKEEITEKENLSLKLKIIGIVLLFLPILSYTIANRVSQDFIAKKISDRENLENKRIVTVDQVSDEFIYTTKGNPIGIKISYNVNFISYYLGDDMTELEKLTFEFDPDRFLYGTGRLCPHPVLSSRNPNTSEHDYYVVTDELLTNKRTYHIVEYLLPCSLLTEKKSSPIIDLEKSCFDNFNGISNNEFVDKMRSLPDSRHFSAKIKTPSPYRWTTASSIKTHSEYSIGAFYDTMYSEILRTCRESEPDLVERVR